MKKVFISILISLFFQASFAHAFELDDFTGKKVNLEDKIGQGKWTLVMFWAHDCSLCRAESPAISEFFDRRKDVDVIGISIDGEANKALSKAFLAEVNPSFPSYLSELPLVAVNYKVLTQEDFRGTPTFLLFNPEGDLLGNNPGPMSTEALERFIERNS